MQARSLLLGVAAGAAAATAVHLGALMAAAPPSLRLVLSGVAGIAMAGWMTRANWTITPAVAARLIEADAS